MHIIHSIKLYADINAKLQIGYGKRAQYYVNKIQQAGVQKSAVAHLLCGISISRAYIVCFAKLVYSYTRTMRVVLQKLLSPFKTR